MRLKAPVRFGEERRRNRCDYAPSLTLHRRATMVRILAYETNGYWLMTKRLSQGRYEGWPRAGEAVRGLQAVQLRQLLAGTLP